MRCKPFAAVTLFALGAQPALGQQIPPGWQSRLDKPAQMVFVQQVPEGSWRFQEMIPGMHVTTGPGVLLIAPEDSVGGRFAVAADLLLFPNSTDNGYGIAFGVQQGGAAATAWNAFLVSGTGQYALLSRQGDSTSAVIPWTTNEAVKPRGRGVATNRVSVAAEPDSIRFSVNGAQVAAVARASLSPDGRFGLRFEEGVNLHITNVDLTRRLLKK